MYLRTEFTGRHSTGLFIVQIYVHGENCNNAQKCQQYIYILQLRICVCACNEYGCVFYLVVIVASNAEMMPGWLCKCIVMNLQTANILTWMMKNNRMAEYLFIVVKIYSKFGKLFLICQPDRDNSIRSSTRIYAGHFAHYDSRDEWMSGLQRFRFFSIILKMPGSSIFYRFELDKRGPAK